MNTVLKKSACTALTDVHACFIFRALVMKRMRTHRASVAHQVVRCAELLARLLPEQSSPGNAGSCAKRDAHGLGFHGAELFGGKS